MDLLQSEITLVEDVPCRACGYNLRGLTLPGRCPECGENLDYSVQEFDAARHLTLPVDRGWAGQILEGARLSLISFGLIVAVSFAPGWMWESKKPGRVLLLTAAATWWVLAMYGVLKLSRVEPQLHPARRPWGLWWLRITTIAYGGLAFVPERLNQHLPEALILVLVVPAFLGGFAAAALLYWRIRQLAGRLGSLALSIQATLLTCVMPIVTFICAFALPGGPDSLTRMLGSPLPQYGSPEFIRKCVQMFPWLGDVIIGLVGFAMLTAVAVHVQMIVLMSRARKISSEARGGKSRASFGP